jgi:Domain of unknown function (DUF4349)
MNTRLITLFALFALLLVACAPAFQSSEPAVQEFLGEPQTAYDNAGGFAPAAPMEAPAAEIERSFISPEAVKSGEAANRIVIKNAREELVVDAPDKSMEAIGRMAEEMGGFVVAANMYQSYLENGQEVPRASITVRVPAERLNEALERIEAESDQLPRNKTIDSQDVTAEYTDLESRLRNLEAAEAQLVKIMDDAVRTEDVLNVYNQLVSVREQIEVIKGQMRYYEESAKLSAISVDLIANAAVQPITAGGWEPLGVIKDAIQALIRAFQGLADAAIWLVIFVLPVLVVVLLPLALVVVLIRRARARRRSRRLATPPANPDSDA